MIKAGTPIELIEGLSNHTIKSLNRNKIFFVGDLFNYKISEISDLPGIGKNVIKELGLIFDNIDLYNKEYLKNSYRKVNIEEDKDNKIELSPFFVYNGGNYYLNSLCYIAFPGKNAAYRRIRNYFKENHTTFFDLICKEEFLSIESIGKGSSKEIIKVKYKILDYYGINSSKKLLNLYSCYSSKKLPFEQVNILNLNEFIWNFYSNLSEAEKGVVLNRENWFKNSSFSRFHEIGKNYKVTGERVRQFGIFINSDLNFYLQYHSRYFENYIEKILELNDDFETRKFSELKEFSQFSYGFISSILSKIIESNYLFYKNDLSNTLFFLKRSKIGEIKDFKLFDVIDRSFYKERKIEKSITIYNLTKLGLGKDADKKTISEFIPITKFYLENVFNLKEENGKVILPINKRNYPSLIINELILYNKRIHYSNLYDKLRKKYPQYSWSKSTVHRVLQASSDSVNVGPGLYVHKSKRPNSKGFETIVEIVEKYLAESKVKCAAIDDVIKHVKKQKKVSESSIKIYLMNNDKFIHLGEGIYGLAKNREGKPILQKSSSNSESIVKIVEKYLEQKEDKCATTDNIINYVKSQREASEKSIIRLIWDSKRNKNKFMRIGTGVFGLTNYREGKPKLEGFKSKSGSNSESIVETIRKFLEQKEDKCATTKDIINYVKSQREVSEKSIKTYLNSKKKNKNKFIYIGKGTYGLTSYREGKI